MKWSFEVAVRYRGVSWKEGAVNAQNYVVKIGDGDDSITIHQGVNSLSFRMSFFFVFLFLFLFFFLR